jgi:predicted nucleotidyltransferase
VSRPAADKSLEEEMVEERDNRAKTKQDVLERLLSHAGELQALGLARVGLFGSFVRGTADRDSDVDVLLEFRPNEKSFDRYMEAIFLLEEILARRIDAVTPEGLHSRIAPYVLREVEYVTLAA